MEPLLELLGKKRQNEPQGNHASPESNQREEDALKLRLYRLIIDRYRDKIEEYETKSVSDLKLLVQPRHMAIAKIKESIAANFHPYIYEEHFLSAAKMAFAHVSSFKTIPSPVPFWLSLDDVSELSAGDEIDKSIFLCSLLRALGSENARVHLTGTQNSYVAFQFLGKNYLADHSHKELLEIPPAQLAGAMKGKALYAFSDLSYEDFEEG